MTPKNPARVPATLHPFDTTQATSAPSGGVRVVYQDNWSGVVDAQGVATVEKAPSDGVYTDANGVRFLVRKGGNIPDGMTFTADDEAVEALDADATEEESEVKPETEPEQESEAEPEPEERAEEAAPENRMLTAAPENRAGAKPKKDSA